MKELCEVEGIKFYDTPEMGIACRVSEINRAIAGKSNSGSFRRDMVDYQHVKAVFPNSEERNKQIQYLKYLGTGQKLFISLDLILAHLEGSKPNTHKEGWNKVLQAIKQTPILKSSVSPTYKEKTQEETMKELCEVEGIKFYDTPEMGPACSMSEINRVITGKSNGSFKRLMLNYQHIKDTFPNPEEKNKQIQNLGTDQRVFVSLDLVCVHLKGTKPRRYKEQYNAILRGIEENFPQLNESPSDPDSTSDPNTTSDFDTTTPKQELLPIAEEEYSFLYIAKAGIVDDPADGIITPLDIHFGITAGDPKSRIKVITSGSYKAQLIATVAFQGTQERNNKVKVACEECAALETWFKNNPKWLNIRGSDESFRYEDPWKELLEEIEGSQNTGPPFYSLYPDSSIIRELVPEHLIPKVHDFGESVEMIEIARLYKGSVIPDENNLNAYFDNDWIVVQGLHRVKRR